MSGNQKQTATGGPQARFSNSTQFQPISQPNRGEATYSVTPTGAYVPQQPNQGGNPGPTLRALQPNVPPNQSSTPPNAGDIKVQTISQPPMNPMFVQQVRSNQHSYYPRAAGPTTQTQRMSNHNNRTPQALYGPQAQYLQLQPLFIPASSPMQYYTGQRPPGFVQPTMPMYTGQPMPTSYQYNTQPAQAPGSVNFFYNPPMMPHRTGPVQQTQSGNPNPAQTNPAVPLMTNTPPHQPLQRQQMKRRPNALQIIDPDTGADRLNEIFEQDSSHPPSGESSARQTPQPTNKEVQATFAKQVLLAINTEIDNVRINDAVDPQHNSDDHPIEAGSYPTPPTQPAVQAPSNRLEHIVQSSNLKAQAKEFILNTKETPIVSANCNSVEVTLPNRPLKDRESPFKGRKQRDQVVREYKDTVKEPSVNKEPAISEKPSIIKDVEIKPKEVALSSSPSNITTTNVIQAPVVNKEVAKEGAPNEKRTQRKDLKAETKMPSIESTEEVSVTAPVAPVDPATSVALETSAKTKQNAQRAAQKQAQSQNNSQKSAQATVPPPQPAKANNKSHKKNELNQKGANKEGTDMDAFNDNGVKEEVNANANADFTSNDVINANIINATNSTGTIVHANVVNNEHNSKAIKNNDVPTIKTETVKPLKPKVDITDIVREKPKALKLNPPVESHDETDKAVITTTDKLVQAKNEANANNANENNGNSKLPYLKNQWSPWNQTGDKIYHKELLLILRNSPFSKRKPENIIPEILADDRRLGDGRQSMGGRTDFTNPPFSGYGGKSGSQRGGVGSKHGSQTKLSGSGNKNMRGQVKVSISVREDVKLHETENAWRPARLNKAETATDDDKKTAELYKKVRGVLNKLTPQKFDTLLSQIKGLQIDTAERLQGVIDLVFEKAVDEPNFSVAYALMCKELALMQVPTANSTEDKPELVNFRKLLVTRCQVEFEKQSVDESVRTQKIKEIAECNDPEKKKDLQFDLEEHDRRLRMKSVGNIRFIGELFKQNMLTVNIMMRCLNNLLENKDEESLECLCKLLTTIGKEIEQKSNLSPIFNAMKSIVDKKDSASKISSRIRFMLQDVIDLKNCKWVPRRQDLNPKTIDQIQKEADNEQMNIQLMMSTPMPPRKDDRGGSGPNVDRKGGRGGRNVSDDGWTNVNTSRNRSERILVQSDKLKSKAPLIDEPFGSSQLFGTWGKGSVGSNIKAQPQSVVPNTNMYAALENIDMEKRSLSNRAGNKEPYSSKGPSLERSYGKYDGRGSRSGSQHRSNDSSASSSQRSTPAPVIPQAVPKPAQFAPVPQLTEEQMERRINNCLDEYVTGSCTEDEFFLEINAVVPASYIPRMVEDCYNRVLEKSQSARSKTGTLFARLVKANKIHLEQYCTGLEAILSQADELKIDIPKIWDYLAEILVDLVCEEALPLNRLKKIFHGLSLQGHTIRVLAPLFRLIIDTKGPNFLQSIWLKSGLQFSDLIPSAQVNSFLKDNQFEFLIGGSGSVPVSVSLNQLSFDQIQNKLSDFLRSKTPLDDTVKWIAASVGDRTKEPKFIRALATAIFEDSISENYKLMHETLAAHSNLLLKYVDNNPTYELQCLYALQALIHKMEHPQGLLLSICDKLYEGGTFSQESFISWETSHDPAEQEGKGVALKQLTCFFTQLKENDEEEDYGSSTSDDA